MAPVHVLKLETLMNDFVHEVRTGLTQATDFQRDGSMSVMIRPVQPVHVRAPWLDECSEVCLYEETEAEIFEEREGTTRHTPRAPIGAGAVSLAEPMLLEPGECENACWRLLSGKMRTALQTIMGYSELIEEDLVEGDHLEPLSDLMRIRHVSEQLLGMAEQIERVLRLEREKRHLAERLGALTRQLSRAVDSQAIYAATLSNLAALIPFEEACLFERGASWELTGRWGKHCDTARDAFIDQACYVVARAARPCVQRLSDGEALVTGFGIYLEGVCVAVLMLRGELDTSQQAYQAGVVKAFLLQAEKALAGLREIDQIKRLANFDGLTGALNRRAFFERAKASEGERSVVMLDIDHFKRINDTYGHAAGDEVLREITRRVSVTLREGDLIGRYGGEEFALLLDVQDAQLARQIAERVRAAIATLPIALPQGESIFVTASLGVCSGSEPIEQMLGTADELLYLAKQSGRDRVCAG